MGFRKNMSNQRPERPAQHSTRMETRCEGANKELLPRTTRHQRREPCAALNPNGNEVRGSKKGSYLARRAIKEERPGQLTIASVKRPLMPDSCFAADRFSDQSWVWRIVPTTFMLKPQTHESTAS